MPLWLIDYDNAHWCGGQMNVVVRADSADEALYLAEVHMEENQRELFADEYHEEGDDYDNECSYFVNSVELFDENHEEWQYYMDPVQRDNFYPLVER